MRSSKGNGNIGEKLFLSDNTLILIHYLQISVKYDIK